MNNDEEEFLLEIERYLSIMTENEIHSISVSPGKQNEINISEVVKEMRRRNFVFNFEETDLGEIMITRIGFGEIINKIFEEFPKIDEIKFGSGIKDEKKEEIKEMTKEFKLNIFFKRNETIIRRKEKNEQ
jgi:hypothetical protein